MEVFILAVRRHVCRKPIENLLDLSFAQKARDAGEKEFNIFDNVSHEDVLIELLRELFEKRVILVPPDGFMICVIGLAALSFRPTGEIFPRSKFPAGSLLQNNQEIQRSHSDSLWRNYTTPYLTPKSGDPESVAAKSAGPHFFV